MEPLTLEDVVRLLEQLRLNPSKRHFLHSGSDLMREATNWWGDSNEFRHRMVEARQIGLVDWQPAQWDHWGDDLNNARDFHLTFEGPRFVHLTGTMPIELRVARELEDLLLERNWTTVRAELKEGDRQLEDQHWVDAVSSYYSAVESALKVRLAELGAEFGDGSALKKLASRASEVGAFPRNYQALFGFLDSI